MTFHFTCHARPSAGAMLIAAAAAALPVSASAQTTWPTRPVRLIVPFPPGGGSDVIARVVGARLSSRLGQQVVIDNRAGAGGALATEMAARASPDGHTLLFTTTAMATLTASGRKLSYDLMKDLAPIGQIGATPLLIVVPVNSSAKTLRELMELARARPNSVKYGSSGVGSMSHIGMELIAAEAKVQLLHVPYRGTALAMTDLVAGQIQAVLGTFATLWQLVEGGKLRALVVTGAQRSAFAPNLPTVVEAGLPGARIDFWWGLMGPAQMPPRVVKRLNDELNAVLAQPETHETLAREGAIPKPATPEDFGKLMVFEVTRWSKLIKDANINAQ
jgi:tripartite-type tricarboxylate transporter receptor subunit TctC